MRIGLLILSSLALAWPALAADISARLDRNPVPLNESFTLVLESETSVDEDPDFTPLAKDFEVLQQSSSSSVNIVNGQVSRVNRWTVHLMARRAGELSIPALSFGRDRSNPIQLKVLKARDQDHAAGDSPLLLEMEVDTHQPYVQQQVLISVRLLHKVDIANGKLSDPQVDAPGSDIQRLGEDHSYTTQRGGQSYRVIERRYALYPARSGTLTIQPVTLVGQLRAQRRSLFDSPFGNGRQIRRQSPALELTVRPVPEAFPGQHWLPARRLSLLQTWPRQPPRFSVGEPVTRTLALLADGLRASQLPELDAPRIAALKTYPDQPVLKDQVGDDGISGLRQQKMALIPARPGTLELPAIELPWWNTEQDRLEWARLPAARFPVAASERETSPTPSPTPDDQRPTGTLPAATGQDTASTSVTTGLWPWLSVLLALGWLVTGLLWWRKGRTASVKPDPARHRRTGLRQIRRACRDHSPGQARDALLGWAHDRWPHDPPANLGALAQRVGPEAAGALAELEAALYGAGEQAWDGQSLLQALDGLAETRESYGTAAEDPLQPLFRH